MIQENSNVCRVWKGLNTFIGGSTFFVGSVILFPFFEQYFNAATVSAWLYTFGSFCYLLVAITDWCYFEKNITAEEQGLLAKISKRMTIFISTLASLLFLIGSAFFIPKLDELYNGEYLFIQGTALLAASEAVKSVKIMLKSDQSCLSNIRQKINEFLISAFVAFGAFLFFVGTIVLRISAIQNQLLLPAVIQYSVGGLLFFLSSLCVLNKYFFDFCEQYKQTSNEQLLIITKSTLIQ